MSKPLPPDPKAVDWPNALQIAKLSAEIGQLHDIRRDRDPTAKAQIDDEIKQREAAQLYLYQQTDGHGDVKTFGQPEKATVAAQLTTKIKELRAERALLAPPKQPAAEQRKPSPEISVELTPAISRLDDRIRELSHLVALLTK